MLANSLNSMLDNVAKPLKSIIGNMAKVADGDLRDDVNVEAKGDIKTAAEATQKMIDGLRVKVGQITRNANIAATSAEEMSSSSEEVNASTEQVSSAIQQVAKGGQDLSKLSQDTKNGIESVRTATKKVAENSMKTAENATNAEKKSEIGLAAGNKAGAAMTTISETADQTADNISSLDAKSKEIGKIIEVINNISEQTNLLALNAAIEAARAGEAGRGFAVVADEVRKLAEESQKATTQIADLINSVQTETKNSVMRMSDTKKAVDNGSAVITEAIKSLEEIGQIVKEISSEAQELSALAEESQAGVEQVAKSAQKVNEIAEESASSSEEVSASMQETTSSMTQVSAAAQELAKGAEELKEIVATFKTNDASGKGDAEAGQARETAILKGHLKKQKDDEKKPLEKELSKNKTGAEKKLAKQ